MDWVKEFYSKQNEWFAIYLGKIDESHHKRAWLVQEMGRLKTRSKILELGAGGGQTAAAMANLGHDVTMIELLPDSAKKRCTTCKRFEKWIFRGN
jgi:protein-L-isoaspartate O-methyltransferase